MAIADLIKTEDFKKEKHMPVIEVAGSVAANTAFDVTVTVGKEIAHPNTTEHFIANITLYFKPEGAGAACQIGRAEFSTHGESAAGANQGPAYTEPCATFKVKLAKAGTLTAIAYCNIHGLWEASKEVEVR